MFRSPYYMYDKGYYHVPYNYFKGYVYSPFMNYVQSNIASTNQSIYNNGYMTDVFQNSNIIQTGVGVGCTQPPAEPPTEPSVEVPQ